jgi:hypothetical protein
MARFPLSAASAGTVAFILALTMTPGARALPKFQRPGVPIDPATGIIIDCPDFLEPTVELVRYTSLIGYPIVGFTVRIFGDAVKFHGRPNPACGFPDFVAPLPAFAWSLPIRPVGSIAQLFDTTTLSPRLPLDVAGAYVVRLTVCPAGCTVQPPGSHLSPITVEPQVLDVPIQALESAPLAPETTPAVVPSSSAGLSVPPGQCDFGAGAISKQWWAVREVDDANDYRLLEGAVRHSRVSRKDSPLNHDSQDTNYHIEPDPKYSDVQFEDDDAPIPEPIEVEWERSSIPERYRPTPGDRASIFGYWVTDCGHGRPEIHPPVGVAVHRPRPIRIPDNKTFPELGGQTAGTGLYVPGVITDMYFGTDGGDLVNCGTDTGLANAERVPGPNGIPIADCVPAPSLNRVFEFDIYLPRNPQVTMRQAGFTVPPAPLYVQSDPVTGAPEPNIEARTDPSGILTYLHVTLDLRGYSGPNYAHRIAAGWVLPSANNWGLARYKLRLVRLNVTDDGDGALRGDGDWRLWVNTNNASNESLSTQEWVQIIDYDVHGIEDFGGRAWETGRPGEPGAPAADRSLGPDLLRYPPATSQPIPGPRDYGILFHSTGYEADTLTDDDAGTVLHTRLVPGPAYSLPNQCIPSEQAAGLLYSGCVRYTAVVEVVPGPALANAVLSQAGQGLADQYVLRCGGRQCVQGGLDSVVAAPLEATPVDPREVPLSARVAARDFTDFPAFEPAERESVSLTDIVISDFYRDVVVAQKSDPATLDRVLRRLRSVVFARVADRSMAREAILDAQILKASLPFDLWAKYFGGLPTLRPEPGASKAKFLGAGVLEGQGERVRLKTVHLNCDALRRPNFLSLIWKGNRFDLDLVLEAECTDGGGRRAPTHTQRGTGIGRLNGIPGAAIEWTLVDGSGEDTAAITVWSGDGVTSVLEASGPVRPGRIEAIGHRPDHGCASPGPPGLRGRRAAGPREPGRLRSAVAPVAALRPAR